MKTKVNKKKKISTETKSDPLKQGAVMRSAKDFKVGQNVRLKDDFECLLWVAKYNGKKCLKMSTCLGWRYFEPENWNDVLPSQYAPKYNDMSRLYEALCDPLWIAHRIGDTYIMDGKSDLWKIAYYPIFENGKNGEVYEEPRALVEKPILGGTDFREVPLRYLTKNNG